MTQELKSVDIGWIKEIPNDWNLKKVKEVYEFVSVKVSDSDYPALTVSSKYGITPQMEHVAKTLNGDSRKRVEKGDFVINSRADRPGACGISAYDGSVSMICHVLKPRNKELLQEEYMHYLFRNNTFSQEFYRWGRGIVSDLWSTRKDEFGNLQLPIPPIKIQKRIGEYLKYKEQALNSLIELKVKQLEKLEQQRQSIIKETVTKGLNPNVKMKDSGVEWIGEIPDCWNTIKLKFISEMKSGTSIDSNNINEAGKYRVYGGGELRGYTENYTHYGEYIVVGRQGANCGQATFVSGKFWATEHAVVVSTKKVEPSWLYYVLKSMNLNQYSMSAAQPGIAVSTILNLSIPFPTLDEQKEVMDFLVQYDYEITKVVNKTILQIEKLKEYRQSLIYEAVTGKIDVREMEID